MMDDWRLIAPFALIGYSKPMFLGLEDKKERTAKELSSFLSDNKYVCYSIKNNLQVPSLLLQQVSNRQIKRDVTDDGSFSRDDEDGIIDGLVLCIVGPVLYDLMMMLQHRWRRKWCFASRILSLPNVYVVSNTIQLVRGQQRRRLLL